jgi:hypothetical protein
MKKKVKRALDQMVDAILAYKPKDKRKTESKQSSRLKEGQNKDEHP